VQDNVLEIKGYQREWLQHVDRTDRDRITKQAKDIDHRGREA
jgi:hypothetical protein